MDIIQVQIGKSRYHRYDKGSPNPNTQCPKNDVRYKWNTDEPWQYRGVDTTTKKDQ